jgi:trans-aconitate 2-methyltransferase
VLQDAFPGAEITGMDSSADMLTKARASLPGVDFVSGDVSTYQPDKEADLVFSNAVFHWLRHAQRIPTLAKLFTGLESGGVLAIQMPANYHEHSHIQMRVVASLPDRPWSRYFSQTRIGDLADTSRPDLDPVEDPGRYYDALSAHAASVDIWSTKYMHVLSDAGAIVEWVKGTGLQPYLNAMGEDEGAKEAFLGVYEECLREKYPVLVDGKVLLGYPRLFVVAVRK